MNRAVLFARVSTKDQAEEGFSLSSQVKTIHEYAKRNQIIILKEFVVPESARGVHERTMFMELIRYIEQNKKVNMVLCEKVDRISRNFKDAITIDNWLNTDKQRSVHFIKQNLVIHRESRSNEKFQWDIHLVLARNYSNNLSEETRKGLDEKAELGWYPGNQKRGYTTIGAQGRKEWVIDRSPESDAPFIKKAFELAAQGQRSIKQIRLELFADGWKTAARKPIAVSVVHQILTDPFYCGDFVWKEKRMFQAKHMPLIGREIFEQVQQNLTRRLPRAYKKQYFLFQGMMRCGECGRTISGEIQKGHRYYKCTRHNTNCSQRAYIREEDIEQQILDLLAPLTLEERVLQWIRNGLKESHGLEKEYHARKIKIIDDDYMRVLQRLDRLYDDKVDGLVTNEMYERKYLHYVAEQERLLTAKQRHQKANESYFKMSMDILELSQRARELYSKKATRTEKQELLRILFSNLYLKDKKLVSEYKKSFQLIAEKAQNSYLAGETEFIAEYRMLKDIPNVDSFSLLLRNMLNLILFL